jgi:hypothetical protein
VDAEQLTGPEGFHFGFQHGSPGTRLLDERAGVRLLDVRAGVRLLDKRAGVHHSDAQVHVACVRRKNRG